MKYFLSFFLFALVPTLSLAEAAPEIVPPRIPGEVVTTESGRSMRVWSTAGRVETNQPAIAAGQADAVGNVGVIVDTRRNAPNGATRPPISQPVNPRRDTFDVRRK